MAKSQAPPKEITDALFTIPRPAQASLPAPSFQLYDVPVQSRGPPAPKEPVKQQLYDIPASPRKAGGGAPGSQPSRQSVPVISMVALRRACYNTLPNPEKSEWIYDTPVSTEKADVRNAPLTSFVEASGPHEPPRYISSLHSPLNSTARSLAPHLQKNVPGQEKLSLPEIPSYSFPTPRDKGVNYRVPSSFLIPRVEEQNTTPNIYDIPKAVPVVPQAVTAPGKANGACENCTDCNPSWLSRQVTSASPEPDRLSINSSDSRVSVVSSCSFTSTDSSSSSCSEESAKELSWDLDLAKGIVTALQHKVTSAISGLMLFVSRNWRSRDYLEANIGAIHRATNHIEESLREFLDFARGVCGTTCNLTHSNFQARVRDQLHTISNSYQILLETKESLDRCNWSLETLVTDKVQDSPDDLETFVMVARVVPEDIKRFASIIIANGRLLFKQNCDKEETVQLTPNAKCKLAKCIQLPQREFESYQRSAPSVKQRESEHSPEVLKKNWTNVCEQCRLYFGALFKAISVFNSSLSHSQPPESFIAQSKLIIMVGQKLVDTLCKETQDRDTRNEILCRSSHLCSLLKNVALATKHAVLEYPSPTALGHLQAEAQKLEHHTRQFRGMLE
ncbi:PREDICTED: cas scaffolding protein family member 4 [Hipposideros armiger]|uniref:Cas scaffolding protein family member 4 n=1 Tax=Hipposideros armiger TaxID=186990 RepID=A0A8B7QY36_HIPAR|nr:PREDICTED: cas scaffolding protein family member 4 [Hipposideros armiger]